MGRWRPGGRGGQHDIVQEALSRPGGQVVGFHQQGVADNRVALHPLHRLVDIDALPDATVPVVICFSLDLAGTEAEPAAAFEFVAHSEADMAVYRRRGDVVHGGHHIAHDHGRRRSRSGMHYVRCVRLPGNTEVLLAAFLVQAFGLLLV